MPFDAVVVALSAWPFGEAVARTARGARRAGAVGR